MWKNRKWTNRLIKRVVITNIVNNGAALPASFTLFPCYVFLSDFFPPSLFTPLGNVAVEIPDTKTAVFFNTGALVPSTRPICILNMHTHSHTRSPSPAAHAACHSFRRTNINNSTQRPVCWPAACVRICHLDGRQAQHQLPLSGSTEINRHDSRYVTPLFSPLLSDPPQRAPGSRPKFSRNERSCRFHYCLTDPIIPLLLLCCMPQSVGWDCVCLPGRAVMQNDSSPISRGYLALPEIERW